MTSNGGALLLRQADRMLGLMAAVARGLADDRQRGKVRHQFVDMLRQLQQQLDHLRNHYQMNLPILHMFHLLLMPLLMFRIIQKQIQD